MAKREEGRGAKFGRLMATWVNHTIDTLPLKGLVPESEIEEYWARFIEELKNYSFEPRKKGDPRNSGCVRELDGYDDLVLSDPVCFARLIKEDMHLDYQKGTSRRVYASLMKHLKQY